MLTCQQCSTRCAEEAKYCASCGFPIGALRNGSGDPLIGRKLGAGYVILEAVGAGGMGRVYRAEQTALGKTLAVKVIHPHLAGDEASAARFYAEARACSRLNHPNSVSVLDFGRTEDGLLFIVMEYLRGIDLARLIWESGPLQPPRAVEVIRQVLAALAEAHAAEIIHRDIKPENILVESLRTGDDFVKVVDFGLAKIRSDASPGVTLDGHVCGTPDFMAPEQGRGLEADPRSDLYATAVVLYHIVTGRLPFEAGEPLAVMRMHVNDPPPDPRTFNPDLPDGLVEVILRGMEKAPEDRYQTAVDFADALQRSLDRPTPVPAEPLPTALRCHACAAALPPGLKFCGECGARVRRAEDYFPDANAAAKAARASVRPATELPSLGELPFLGRDAELSMVELAHARAAAGLMVSLRITGDEGSGRNRLLRTVAEAARRNGERVVRVGPDAAWAGVPYAAASKCMRELLGVDADADAAGWVAQHSGALDPVVRAGLLEVFTPEGVPTLDANARSEAAVRAMLYALRECVARGRGRPVFVAFEQVSRMDAATVRLLAGLHARTVQIPVFLVMTHGQRFDAPWARGEVLNLKGLDAGTVVAILQSVRARLPVDVSLDLPRGEVMPLHLEQLVRWNLEGGGEAPKTMVDLIALRSERLPSPARRTLQALAVLGEATPDALGAVSNVPWDDALRAELESRGWVTVEGPAGAEVLRWAHPFLREVVEATTPAPLRSEMHRARHAQGGDELPLEVQALHAQQGEESFQSLLLLDRVGDCALARGDDYAGAFALRRGLEIARRELTRGEVDDPEQAIAIFARKLGDALVRTGELSEAEGVLREGLAVTKRGAPERLRIEGVLGRVLFARGRRPEGLRIVDTAVSVAERVGARAVAAELLELRAELETVERAHLDAAKALETAEVLVRESWRGQPTDAQRRHYANLLLRLGRSRRLAGVDDLQALEEARTIAASLGYRVVVAQCEAEAAEQSEALGERRAAMAAWRRAVNNAHEAGDAALELEYDERLRRLGRSDAYA
ncbi:MAG: serine/threonine protein kinase [Myxococcaceae bacterium]|nr:serine/threonine protein kinase [Myxococcaceae bacterium]